MKQGSICVGELTHCEVMKFNLVVISVQYFYNHVILLIPVAHDEQKEFL